MRIFTNRLIELSSDVSEMKDIDVSKRLVRGALGQVEEAGKGQNIHSAENSLERKTEEVLPG